MKFVAVSHCSVVVVLVLMMVPTHAARVGWWSDAVTYEPAALSLERSSGAACPPSLVAPA